MKMHIEEESAFGCCWQPSEKIYQAKKVMCIIWMHLACLIIITKCSSIQAFQRQPNIVNHNLNSKHY